MPYILHHANNKNESNVIFPQVNLFWCVGVNYTIRIFTHMLIDPLKLVVAQNGTNKIADSCCYSDVSDINTKCIKSCFAR